MKLSKIIDFCSNAESCIPIFILKGNKICELTSTEYLKLIEEKNTEVDYYDFDLLNEDIVCLVKLLNIGE